MARTEATRGQISTRMILTGVLIFNIVAIGLSEIQRRALMDRADETLATNLANQKKVIEDTGRTLAALSRTMADMQRSLDSVHVLVSGNMDHGQLEKRIISQLNDGKQIVVRFDRNASETRGKAGNVHCGPESADGYLGAFIAGQQYSISYDKMTHQWTGTGPSQTDPYDPDTATCRSQTATYGLDQLGQDIAPETRNVVLWGARFRFEGLNIFQSDRKVGYVIWLE